jgi:hypothetical protein
MTTLLLKRRRMNESETISHSLLPQFIIGRLPIELRSSILEYLDLHDLTSMYKTSSDSRHTTIEYLRFHPILRLPHMITSENLKGLKILFTIPIQLTMVAYGYHETIPKELQYCITPQLISLILRNKNTIRTIDITSLEAVYDMNQIIWTASQCPMLENINFKNEDTLSRPSLIHLESLMMMTKNCKKLTSLTFDCCARLFKFHANNNDNYNDDDDNRVLERVIVDYRYERQGQLHELIISGMYLC